MGALVGAAIKGGGALELQVRVRALEDGVDARGRGKQGGGVAERHTGGGQRQRGSCLLISPSAAVSESAHAWLSN